MLLTWLVACGPSPAERLSEGLALAPSDPAAAAEMLDPACEDGVIEACDAAGALPLDDPRRSGWNERACGAGIAAACVRRSESPDDPFTARACSLGDGGSCAARAAVEALPAEERATLLAQACTAGSVRSCLPAGDRAREAGDREGAAAMYGLACRADATSAACLLAERVLQDSPKGDVPWPEGDAAAVSEALWERCAANVAWACLQLAEHVERGGGPLPAKARGGPAWLRDQACDLQLTYACAQHDW